MSRRQVTTTIYVCDLCGLESHNGDLIQSFSIDENGKLFSDAFGKTQICNSCSRAITDRVIFREQNGVVIDQSGQVTYKVKDDKSVLP